MLQVTPSISATSTFANQQSRTRMIEISGKTTNPPDIM